MCPNSEQQLIDCNPHSSGCRSGWYKNAWTYLNETGMGLMMSLAYLYKAKVSKIGLPSFWFKDVTTTKNKNNNSSLGRSLFSCSKLYYQVPSCGFIWLYFSREYDQKYSYDAIFVKYRTHTYGCKYGWQITHLQVICYSIFVNDQDK